MSAMQEITSARGRKFRPETHARARMIAHRMIAHREVYFSIVAVLFYVQSPACAPPHTQTADLGTDEKAAVFGNRRYWESYNIT